MRLIVLTIIFTIYSLNASPYDSIFERAGRDFGIEGSLLKRIATIESSMNPNAINFNKNGTVDIGLMQINSMHLRRLSSIGVTRESLKDPEVNIYIAALLLSSHIRKRGYNLEAIGCYHSANPVFKNRWLKRLSMANVPKGSESIATSTKVYSNDDPRSRFVQQHLARKTDEKIAQGMNPKVAWRQARAEIDHLMGYVN